MQQRILTSIPEDEEGVRGDLESRGLIPILTTLESSRDRAQSREKARVYISTA
jgi:hypothetical protein